MAPKNNKQLKEAWVDVTVEQLRERLFELGVKFSMKDTKGPLIRTAMDDGVTLESFPTNGKRKQKKGSRAKPEPDSDNSGGEPSGSQQPEPDSDNGGPSGRGTEEPSPAEQLRMQKMQRIFTKAEIALLNSPDLHHTLPTFLGMVAASMDGFLDHAEKLKTSIPTFPLLRFLFFTDVVRRRSSHDTGNAFEAFVSAPEKFWALWDWYNNNPTERSLYKKVKGIAASIDASLCPQSDAEDSSDNEN